MATRRIGRVALVVASAAMLLAACRSADDHAGGTATATTVTAGRPSGSSAGTPSSTTPALVPPTSTTTAARPATTATGLPPTTSLTILNLPADGLNPFTSPSGNISCMILNGTAVRCDIRTRTWAPPPKPANCPSDWGQGIKLSSSGAAFVCAGDTVLNPSAPVLAYGTRAVSGQIGCTSTENGITCTHPATGHGFSMNRDEYSIF